MSLRPIRSVILFALVLAACDPAPVEPVLVAHTAADAAILASEYEVIRLSLPTDRYFRPMDLNRGRQIVAATDIMREGERLRRAVVWQDGKETLLEPLPDFDTSMPRRIMDDGTVYGFSSRMYAGGIVATVWVDGVPAALPFDMAEVFPYDFSAGGEVLLGLRSGPEMFLWTEGVRTQLVALDGGTYVNARWMNDHGHVVGRTQSGPSSYAWALWTAPETPTEVALNVYGDFTAVPVAFNALGQVLVQRGRCGVASRPEEFGSAYVWAAGVATEIPAGDGSQVCVQGMSNSGEVLGTLRLPGLLPEWVIWKRGGSSGTTPVGEDIEVTPTDQTSGEPAAATITFESVVAGGETTVASGEMNTRSAPPSPSGFRLGTPPTYYDIETTATFSGVVTVCISYEAVSYPSEDKLRLLHYTDGGWVDITTSLDTEAKTICGETTSLSPFLVAQELYPFVGFFPPIDDGLNTVRAGSAVPVKFSLGGYRGTGVLATAPSSAAISCDGDGTPSGAEVPAASPGRTTLSYDPEEDHYVIRWRTEREWAGTCRLLLVRLDDGSEHTARFSFR